MSSLLHEPPCVHSGFESATCRNYPRFGQVCSELHPQRRVLWCEVCRSEPEDLAGYLDQLAAQIATEGHGASALAAAILSKEAREVRVMRATTAGEYEARCEVMAIDRLAAIANEPAPW